MQRSKEETLNRYKSAMGCELGEVHYALLGEMVDLHEKWGDYLVLFAHTPETVELLNRTAAPFFGRYQKVLWRDLILHVARLVDPPQNRAQKNLSIKSLPALVADTCIAAQMHHLVKKAVSTADFATKQRHMTLAHKDLDYVLKRETARELPRASRALMTQAIKAFEDVFQLLGRHYLKSETDFSFTYAGAAEDFRDSLARWDASTRGQCIFGGETHQ